MLGFTEIQFPANIALGASGGPEFSTDIVVMKNGAEQRNVNWTVPLRRYNVAAGVRKKADLDEVTAFFYAQKGRAKGFRYKDWADYQAAGELLAVGDGSETEFQLKKTYTSGALQTVRTITKPVAETLDVFVDGVLQSSGFSVDSATGVLLFDVAPAQGAIISADFEFDVPVRFDSDGIDAQFESETAFTLADVALVEVRI